MYTLDYDPSPVDLWKMTMRGIYSSLQGVINIIFTISVLVLIYKFWQSSMALFRVIMVLGLMLFTVIQPLFIYLNSVRTLEDIDSTTKLSIDDKGIEVSTANEREYIKWSSILGIAKSEDVYVIYTSNNRGYIITPKMYSDYPGLVELIESKRSKDK